MEECISTAPLPPCPLSTCLFKLEVISKSMWLKQHGIRDQGWNIIDTVDQQPRRSSSDSGYAVFWGFVFWQPCHSDCNGFVTLSSNSELQHGKIPDGWAHFLGVLFGYIMSTILTWIKSARKRRVFVSNLVHLNSVKVVIPLLILTSMWLQGWQSVSCIKRSDILTLPFYWHCRIGVGCLPFSIYYSFNINVTKGNVYGDIQKTEHRHGLSRV